MARLIINFFLKIFFKKINIEDEIDSKNVNNLFKNVIKDNFLLYQFYVDCYKIFKKNLSQKNNLNLKILEIGSGPGFIKKILPNTITSEIISLEGIDMQLDAKNLNFDNDSLNVILLLNVFHHISDPEKFLIECKRVLKRNGMILMIEPANTWFSRIIYKNFHHEVFDETSDWYLKKSGRLSSSNQALPFIIFERDIEIFQKKFTDLLILKKFKFKPIHYLFSGGFSYKPRFNGFFVSLLVKLVEIILFPFNRFLGLFMFIKIVKK